MPRDGTIKQRLTRMVVAGALAPLVVAAFAIAALVIAGASPIGIAAVAIIAVALTVSLISAGTQRVNALQQRFERANRLANEVATVRLPEALEAARDGRAINDKRAPLVPDQRDELGDLIAVFDRTQRTAITLAAEQARVRRQASDMFVDLGRRHQALLGRTLSLVGELESSERDPSTVTDLLRLDHLVTRMRRNAESLLVLAGSEPGRPWAEAQTMDDVVRNALSEIEAFDRVDTGSLEADRVVGRAVGAVAHLLAELLENATVFSPPESRVTVNGVHRPDGYVFSIVDTGIGMLPDELADANERLTQFHTAEFTPARHLGLAVVAELARRHGIVVQLQPTPGGGTTASVLLSPALLAGPVDPGLRMRSSAFDDRFAPAAPRVPEPVYAPAPEPTYAPTPPAAAPVMSEPVVPAAPPEFAPPPLPEPEPALAAPEPALYERGELLPRRVPGEHIPDLGRPRRDDDEAPARVAPDVAAQLSGYQEGVERARFATPERAAAAEAPGPAAVPEVADDGFVDEDDLERRTAGAQLPDTGPTRDPAATAPPRNPDEVRNALTTFQHGVARGTLERMSPLEGEEPS
jgi:signal transduction histidine kinase